MDQQEILLIVLGMAIVTYVPRFVPGWFLSSRTLPPGVGRFLRFVPPAVMASMLVPSLVIKPDGGLDLSAENMRIWAAIPTAIVAFTTRSFAGTVAIGVGLTAAARFFLNS